MVLQNKVKNDHWNFKGSTFVSFHPYLGELSYLLDAYIDETAENIRFLREIVSIPLTIASKMATIKERESFGTINLEQSAEEILYDLQSIMMVTQRIVAIAEDENLYATIETFSAHLAGYDKMRYFLENSLESSTPPPLAKNILSKNDENSKPQKVMKTYEDEQLVFGWASIAKYADGTRPVDFQGDFLDAEDLELPTYEYVMNSRELNVEHIGGQEAEIVESVVFTLEKMDAMGIPRGTIPEGLWIGCKVHNKETFEKVKKGELAMFSIEGSAKRVEV